MNILRWYSDNDVLLVYSNYVGREIRETLCFSPVIIYITQTKDFHTAQSYRQHA